MRPGVHTTISAPLFGSAIYLKKGINNKYKIRGVKVLSKKYKGAMMNAVYRRKTDLTIFLKAST